MEVQQGRVALVAFSNRAYEKTKFMTHPTSISDSIFGEAAMTNYKLAEPMHAKHGSANVANCVR